MTKWMDHLLRDTLHGRASTPASACLDAEAAAAFADDTLPAEERWRAEAHVADCARCQALLAALVTMTPVPAPRAWWRRPAIAWLVPAAVAATAIVVWINIPPSSNITPPVPNVSEARRSAERDSPRVTPPPAADAERLSQAAPDSRNAMSALPPSVQQRSRSEAVLIEQAAAAQAPALADNQASVPPTAAPALQSAAAEVTESREAERAEKVAEPPSLAETVTFGTDTSERALARRLEVARDSAVVSSNRISQWRIGTAGVVHHSTDGGSTWQTYSTGVNVPLTAGSSPSLMVCWLVGPGGLVLISTDEGRSWQRVPFPVAVDLVSIRAIDDKTATVVTADQRTFSTSDRGVTWSR